MTNSYQGHSPDDRPTAPRDVPEAGFGGPGWGGRRRRWAAVVAITAVVIGGGAFAAAEAATGSPAAPVALTTAGTHGSATVAAATPTSTSTSTQAKKEAGRHGRLARLRRLGGMYGQATFDTKQGARTLAFERGTIESVAGDDVVVRARSGLTEAWTLTSASVVRENGKRTTDGALAAGELVFAGGPVTGGAHDIRLIVIRTARPSFAQPTA